MPLLLKSDLDGLCDHTAAIGRELMADVDAEAVPLWREMHDGNNDTVLDTLMAAEFLVLQGRIDKFFIRNEVALRTEP